jgi:3-phytase
LAQPLKALDLLAEQGRMTLLSPLSERSPRRVGVGLSALVLMTCLPAGAAAAVDHGTAPTTSQTARLTAIADSYVNSAASRTNYGRSDMLDVDSPATTGYLKFDLSPYAGRKLVSATLHVRATTSGSKGTQNIRLVADTSWSETGITYANRPAMSSTVLGGLGPTNKNTDYAVTLAPAGVTSRLGGLLSLGLDNNSTDSIDLASRETGSTGPALVLAFASSAEGITPGDTSPPTVSSISPASGASGVGLSTAPTATFSEAMRAETVNTSTVVLAGATGNVVATEASFDPVTRTVTLRPAAALTGSTSYSVTIRGGPDGVRDAAGNALGTDTSWTFRTVSSGPAPLPTGPVTASAETVTLPGMTGDVADDPAIWVDESDTSRSVVIGTNKAGSGGGIAVYDLSGQLLQFRQDGKFNNVDLRAGMTLAGRPTVVVVASNRTTNTLAFYRLNTATRQLEPIGARAVSTGFEPYGLCMYKSARTGGLFAFVTQNNGGTTDQYELFDNNGKVDARKVRSLAVGSLSEGCVADDELGHLYIGEEDRGIWKYGAEPGTGSARTAVGTVGDGRLVADVEGMAIASRPGGSGHLIVSSQGDSSYAVYDRRTGAWVRSFKVGGAAGVDGVSDTDGLDVVSAGVGSAFPNGLLVVHDAANTGGASSNYKLVDLGQVLGR